MPGETVMMSPSFQQNVRPDLPAGLRYPYHAVAAAHAGLGVATYVVWYGSPLTGLLAVGRP